MFEREDIGLGAVILIVYFLTRIFAEEWSGGADGQHLGRPLPIVGRRRKKPASESWAATAGRVESRSQG
jgi:hypothetical protein